MSKIFFLIIFVLTFFIRLWAVRDGNFPFTIDQGRDMIDIRNIVVMHKPRLIGPTTSINGVYLGPFWYYFNLPAFIIGQGDPAALLIWQIVSYQLIGLLLYYFLRRSDSWLAFFVSVFYLIMPTGFYVNRYSWNANAMPVFTGLFMLLLYLVWQKMSPLRLFFLGLVAGLSFQIEAALGILLFPFSFLFLLFLTRKIKPHLFHIAGFVLTLAPQVFFEFRHQFPLTKVFLSEIGGHSTMLGARLSFGERLTDRQAALFRLVTDLSHLPAAYLVPLFYIALVLALIAIYRRLLAKPLAAFILINLFFIVFSFTFYLLFPQALKSWYLLGLSAPFVFLYAASLTALFAQGGLWRWGVALLVVLSLYFTFLAQNEYLSTVVLNSSRNKSSLKNELFVIDWVYTHAKGEGFNAYNYLPSVYDYPYQYLYWWYGEKNYSYRPNYVAYLPGQPEYIENMTAYFSPSKPLPENEPTFLIIEKDTDNPKFEQAWMGNFAKLCEVEENIYDFGVTVKHMQKCQH